MGLKLNYIKIKKENLLFMFIEQLFME